jgi:hypothetical protein
MNSKWILRGVAIASVLVSYNCRSRTRTNDNNAPAPTTTAPMTAPVLQPGMQPSMPTAQPSMPTQPADPTAQPGMQPMAAQPGMAGGGDFIQTQMTMRQAQFAAGMGPVLPIACATLATSGTQNYAVNMLPGHCYKIIGVGAPSVTDLDLKLYAPADPSGAPSAVVDQDIATDNFPVIGLQRPLCPTAAGQYRLEVTMYAGTGEFGVQVFGN